MNNVKKSGLQEYVYDFSVDYNTAAVDECVSMTNQCNLV